MIRVRGAAERGRFDHGWLDTRHTFSFGRYYDPRCMGFRALRVINEDWVEPGRGFGAHPHENMEIVTYVLEGMLEHQDSLGNGGMIRPGELQRMTAGTGIVHSEANPSAAERVHLDQIWMLPERDGLKPSYEQRAFPDEDRRNRLRVVASPDGRDGSLTIRQDASLYLGTLEAGRRVSHAVAPGRHAWLQLLRGAARVNGRAVGEGDGVAISEEPAVEVTSDGESEVLVFDLA
jgi:redox-sensitive bicupin YhaK (pirin superfamily)